MNLFDQINVSSHGCDEANGLCVSPRASQSAFMHGPSMGTDFADLNFDEIGHQSSAMQELNELSVKFWQDSVKVGHSCTVESGQYAVE